MCSSPARPESLTGRTDDFVDPDGRERDDQSVLILGAGLAWDVNGWLRLEGAARNYLMEPPDFPVIDPQAAGNDENIQAQKCQYSEQAHFLANNGKNKIRVAFRQILEVSLRAVGPTFAK